MGIFGKKVEVPAWAVMLESSEYSTFIEGLNRYFMHKLKSEYKIEDGILRTTHKGLDTVDIGLDNLMQLCKQGPKRTYAREISNHFDKMLEQVAFNRAFAEIEKDYSKVKKYIAVRLYNKSYFSSLAPEFYIVKEFAGDIQQTLVFDFPQSIMNVKPEQVAHWGVSIDELFQVGINNVRTNYKTESSNVLIHAPKDYLYVYESPHLFGANVLFDLDSLTEAKGEHGYIVAVPNRHLALVYPIQDVNVAIVIKSLCTIVEKFHAQGPGAISREIFWYKAPVFMPLPYSVDSDEVKFFAPDDFMDLLNSLPEAKKP